MTFSPIESIHAFSAHDRSHDVQISKLHKSKNPFSTVAGVNFELIQLARINPGILDMLRKNPAIIRLLNESPSLLQQLIKDPISLQRFLINPSDFLSQLSKSKQFKSDLKPEKQDKSVAQEQLNSLVRSKQRKQDLMAKENITAKTEAKSTSQNQVNSNPHRLESAIMAKAHVENPNTQRSLGEFRFLNRGDLRTSGLIPHDQELQPNLVTTARAFALNPDLLKMMSGEAIALNRTKKLSGTGNPDDDDYEIENETEEALSTKEEIIEKIIKVNNAEPVNKALAGLK